MINLFVFDLKHFREGIISFTNKEINPGITLKLSIVGNNDFSYEYVFTKNTYSEKYLDMICYLLDRIYSAIKSGDPVFKLDFDKKNSSIYASGFIFDRVNVIRRNRDYSQVIRTEYKLS